MTKKDIKRIKYLFSLNDGWHISDIKDFAVYYSGWECDHTGYLLTISSPNEKTVRHEIVLTNHGMEYIATSEELKAYESMLRKEADDMRERLKLIKDQS